MDIKENIKERSGKKICLIIHSLGIGGMERVMHQLATNFAARPRVEVHLILIGINREIVYEIPGSVEVHKPGFEFENSRRTVDTLRTIWFLRQKVKEINPDTILSFGEFWNNLVLFSLLGLQYPVFISDRSEPNKDLGKVHNFLRNLLYPKAAGYIAQTKEAKRVCLKKGWNTNVTVIGNPIRNIPENSSIEKENIVLSVGRLIKTKHFDQLIKMFVEIGNPDWKLMIVGGDAKKLHLSQKLKDQVHQMGAENFVFLEGEQKDINTYYQKSKIFAFTSSSEGFPNVIGEALSAGLPVVAYDCKAGPSDMIEDNKNGFLVPLFNQKEFKNRLKLLIEDDNLKMRFRQNAYDVKEKFHVKKISEKFYSFITSPIK